MGIGEGRGEKERKKSEIEASSIKAGLGVQR